METLRIRWNGPYTIEEARTLRSEDDFGLYAVTRIWGEKEFLRYIGMTYWQNFARRMRRHDRWIKKTLGARIRVGYIEAEEGKKLTEQKVKDAESLLIWCLDPPENTMNRVRYTGRKLSVVNRGHKGPLPRKVDSSFWDD